MCSALPSLSPLSISSLLRVVALHRQGMSVEEIAFLTQLSVRMVKEYLKVR
jgi:DNA-binding NarL/FixJ family response regulator